MPYVVDLPKKKVILNTRNKKIIALFEEAAEEIQARGSAALANAAISGNPRQHIINPFARTIRDAIGFSVDAIQLDSRGYLLDSISYTTREDYVTDLTLFMKTMLTLNAGDTDPMNNIQENEFAFVRELIIRLVTVALSNQAAESPAIFWGHTQQQPQQEGTTFNRATPARTDETHLEIVEAPPVSAGDLINVEGFNFTGFLRFFIQKLIREYEKNENTTISRFFPAWLEQIRNLKSYFNSSEHIYRLDRIENVKAQVALLKSNKRVLSEKLNLLNEISRLLKRMLIFRMVQSLNLADSLSLAIKPSDLVDDWLNTTLYKLISHYMQKSREGIRQFNMLQGNNSQVIQYRVSNETDKKLVHACLTTPILIKEITKNTGITDEAEKLKLDRIFALYAHTQSQLELLKHLSEMNEVIGWLFIFSKLVSLTKIAEMLNIHLVAVKDTSVLSFNDKASKHSLYSAIDTNRVFAGRFGSNFDSLGALEDPSLVEFISRDFKTHCQGLIELDQKLASLPGYKPDMIDKSRIGEIIKQMGISAPKSRPTLTFNIT